MELLAPPPAAAGPPSIDARMFIQMRYVDGFAAAHIGRSADDPAALWVASMPRSIADVPGVNEAYRDFVEQVARLLAARVGVKVLQNRVEEYKAAVKAAMDHAGRATPSDFKDGGWNQRYRAGLQLGGLALRNGGSTRGMDYPSRTAYTAPVQYGPKYGWPASAYIVWAKPNHRS